MGVNSLPKTVAQQRRGSDLNPGPAAPESSNLTTRLPSHPLPQCDAEFGRCQIRFRAWEQHADGTNRLASCDFLLVIYSDLR